MDISWPLRDRAHFPEDQEEHESHLYNVQILKQTSKEEFWSMVLRKQQSADT